jgi:hypothetical protein
MGHAKANIPIQGVSHTCFRKKGSWQPAPALPRGSRKEENAKEKNSGARLHCLTCSRSHALWVIAVSAHSRIRNPAPAPTRYRALAGKKRRRKEIFKSFSDTSFQTVNKERAVYHANVFAVQGAIAFRARVPRSLNANKIMRMPLRSPAMDIRSRATARKRTPIPSLPRARRT